MAPRQDQPLVFTGIRGRDGSTASMLAIPRNKARECLNVDFYRAALGRKRGGSADVFDLTSNESASAVVAALARHVPGADETAAELWLITAAAVIQRLAGGTVWTTITAKDAITARPQDAVCISFNGKLHLLADTAQDRGQVFNPAISTTGLRRTGLATPSAAPTAADTGSGSVDQTIRYYRTREVIQVSGNTVLISEASASVAHTPASGKLAVRVTKPADMGEGATHWRLEESADDSVWYIKTTIAVGTTMYDDTADVEDISSNDLTEIAGEYATPSSFKFGIADGARLLFGNTNEASLDASTVYFTPVIGTTSAAYYDDERVPANNKIPLDPKDGGVITGFGGPFENITVVFKQKQVWRITATGTETDPYRRRAISKVIGSIRQQAVVMAEDEIGNPTLYWLSHLGPYRWNIRTGLTKLVWDVKDIWDTVNLSATTVTCHGVYHSDLHQIWWWVATGSSNEPDTKLIFDTRLGRTTELGDVRDGWAVHDSDSARARCSVMFSESLGTSMSRTLKPYIGQYDAIGRLWKCDTTDLTDVGESFQGLITFADQHLGGPLNACTVGTPVVTGEAGDYEVAVTATPNYDPDRTRTGAVSMMAKGNETRVKRVVENVGIGDAEVYAVSLAIGDAEATASPRWVLDELVVPMATRETLAVTS